MDWPGVRKLEWQIPHSRKERFGMNDFNRKVEEATARLNKSIAEFTTTLEKETAEMVKYLNDEIVPEARQHSTKALRLASEKLARLAEYMESHRK
jgi:vacuolar-type H+-ATPase subunit H